MTMNNELKMNAYFKDMENIGRDSSVTFPAGKLDAFRTWKRCCRFESSEFECESLPRKDDIEDFNAALREAGITAMALTNQSSGLMSDLHVLTENGWVIDAPCIVTRKAEGMEIQGIRLLQK